MAILYPGELDTLTNPTGTDTLSSPDHAGQHSDVNDAVEALEAKIGIDGSADTDSIDYRVNQIETLNQKNIYSTGLNSGGVIGINVDNTKFDVEAGTGLIVDNYTDQENPVITPVSWTAKTAVETPLLTIEATTFVAINAAGELQFSPVDFTAEELRDLISLGWVDHPDLATITAAVPEPVYNAEVGRQLNDFLDAHGPFNISGNDYFPSSLLQISRTAGSVFERASNYKTTTKNPNIISLVAEEPCDILYFLRDAVGGWINDLPAVSAIDPDHYDDASGTLATVPTGHWTIQVISLYPGFATPANDIQYGQETFATYKEALAAVNEIPVLNPYNDGYDTYRTLLVVKQGATDLQNPAQAKFINAGKATLFMHGNIGDADVKAFTDLVDTPSAYTGKAGYALRVNNTADGIMFYQPMNGFTGIVSGGILSVNAGGTTIDVTAGISAYADYTNPSLPVIETLSWDAQTIDPELSNTVSRLWIGVERVSAGVGQFIFADEFTDLQKRTIAIIGRVWGSGTADIDGVGQYTTTAYNTTNTLIDLINALGSLNIDGNIFFANGANLLLNKTDGHSFRYSAGGLNEPTAPNFHHNAPLTGISKYNYHLYGAAVTTAETDIDPEYYDVNGVKTAVPTGKFTIQRLFYYPVSNLTDVGYGQAYYDTMAEAILAIQTENWAMDEGNLQYLAGSILRGYLVVQQGTTSLSDPAKAQIVTASNFGSSGTSAPATGGQSNSVIINVVEEGSSNIVAGQVCYISGSNGTLVTVGLADCDTTPKFRARGLALENIAQGATGMIVVSGSVTLDTRTTNTAINPNAETWAPGDFLYLSNSPGGLTNVRPTSGRSVKIGYTVKGNSNTDEVVIVHELNPVWIAGAAGENVMLRVGDVDGVNKVSIRDYANVEVASIDSNGNATFTNLSGTNTGDETVARIGTLINGATGKTTPVDADMVGLMDSEDTNLLKKLSWANIKATLKTYFDGLYTLANLGGVPTSRTVNSKALSSNVVLGTADVADSTDKRYVTDANLVVIGNTSNTNTGDETAARIATIITGAGAQTTPLDADEFPFYKIVGTVLQKVTWANIKATLKTYFDGLYTLANLGGVPSSRTINGKALSADITLGLASADFANQGTVGNVLQGNAAGNPSWTANTGYTIQISALTVAPADGTTYYLGMNPKAPSVTAGVNKMYIRKAGTIKIAEIYWYGGTAGSNEAITINIRLNNTTNTLIQTVSVSANERVFTNSALAIAVAAGDYVEIQVVCPAWGTNPNTVVMGGYIYIE